MKVLWTLALILSFTSFTYASENAVLLTSLKLSKGKIARLEKTFHKTFDNSGLDIVIHHDVGPALLNSVMRDEQNKVIIWISHSAATKTYHAGISATEIILDKHGNDVKRFFSTPTASLRFLGIVGCQAAGILENFRAKGYYDNYPQLELMSFTNKTKLFSGLAKVLKRATQVLPTSMVGTANAYYAPSSYKLTITTPPTAASGWLELDEKVLVYVGPSNVRQDIVIEIDENYFHQLTNRNIRYVKDLEHSTDSSLGPLSLTSNDLQNAWKLFSKPNSTPIGTNNQHLYIFRE